MITTVNIALIFTAGLASVLSPCVLPILPIIVTGQGDDHKFRPILIVAGLTTTFIIMGILSSLFGTIIGSNMFYVEKIAGIIIILFGILLMLQINLFKHFTFLSQFAQKSKGRFGGYFLGFTLGIIWIPCVGPLLSSVLALVATEGKIVPGIFLLVIYSIGFSIPLLIAGYSSHFFRTQFRNIGKHQRIIGFISGALLVFLGIVITFKGILSSTL